MVLNNIIQVLAALFKKGYLAVIWLQDRLSSGLPCKSHQLAASWTKKELLPSPFPLVKIKNSTSTKIKGEPSVRILVLNLNLISLTDVDACGYLSGARLLLGASQVPTGGASYPLRPYPPGEGGGRPEHLTGPGVRPSRPAGRGGGPQGAEWAAPGRHCGCVVDVAAFSKKTKEERERPKQASRLV